LLIDIGNREIKMSVIIKVPADDSHASACAITYWRQKAQFGIDKNHDLLFKPAEYCEIRPAITIEISGS
jgi:hypothetical protein